MASHILSWGGKDHIVSPALPSTPSIIVSVDSILPYKHDTFSIVQEAAESWVKRTSSLIEPSGSETSTPVSTNPSADPAGDDSFIRHHTYFFKDGNATFLVRGVQPRHWSCKPDSLVRLYAGRWHALLCPPIFLLSRLCLLLRPI
jgi:hypothetical protein